MEERKLDGIELIRWVVQIARDVNNPQLLDIQVRYIHLPMDRNYLEMGWNATEAIIIIDADTPFCCSMAHQLNAHNIDQLPPFFSPLCISRRRRPLMLWINSVVMSSHMQSWDTKE